MSSFGIPLFPEQASSSAADSRRAVFLHPGRLGVFAIVVAVAAIYLVVRYRRRHKDEVGAPIEGNLPLELMWSAIPAVIAMVMFGWGASVFFHLRRPPDEAMQIYAVGKQSMWKFQHLEGQREINELHLPAGQSCTYTSVTWSEARGIALTTSPPSRPPTQQRSAQAAGFSAHVLVLKSAESRATASV